MKQETIQRLNELNRRFYGAHARAFSDTRERPWPGWAHVLQAVQCRGVRPITALDLGCGNGRFGRYLFDRWPARVDYTGLDQSGELLEQARGVLSDRSTARLETADLLAWEPASELRYDLIAAFGLMHHVPGFTNRATLLHTAAQLLAPGGLLAVTFWQFAARERFRRKLAPWSELSSLVGLPIDEADLEPGDHLMRWGHEAEATVRYCHHASNAEVARLLDAAGVGFADRFRCDGLNLYVLATADAAG